MNIKTFLKKDLLVTNDEGETLYPWGMYTVNVDGQAIAVIISAPEGIGYLFSRNGGKTWGQGEDGEIPSTVELL